MNHYHFTRSTYFLVAGAGWPWRLRPRSLR